MGKGNGPEQGKTGRIKAGWERAKKSPCFKLFLVISALFSVLFARFWLGDYAYLYLDVGADTFDINYPLYRLFSDALHSGEYEDYFLNVGLGMDMSSYFYQYLNPLNRAYGENFENLEQYKEVKNFKRILGKLTLEHVKQAVHRSETIMRRNEDLGNRLQQYKGYCYYKENPSLTVWEQIKRILQDCGIL